MAQQSMHLAQGDLVAHPSNPNSVQEDVEAAMKAALEKGEAKPESDGEMPAGDDAKDAQNAETEPTEDKAAKGDDQPEKEEPQPLDPPHEWSAEDQDKFRGLDPETQAWVLDATGRFTAPLQERLQAFDPINKLQQEWAPYLTQRGVGLQQIMPSLLNADMILRTGAPQQKVDLLNKLIHDYQIPIDQGTQPQIPESLQDDPVASAVMPQIEAMNQTIAAMKQQMEGGFKQFEQTQTSALENQVNAWAAETDANGKPLRPYFNEVRHVMGALADQAAPGQQPTLEELYESACLAVPSVRAKVQSAQKASEIAERQKSANAKQRASSSVSSSPGGSRTTIDPAKDGESAYETAMRAMQAHGFDVSQT